jgi:hypothetical protein
LKTSLQQGKAPELQFPPLLWVVQNFFQDTMQMTPQEWLVGLLKSMTSFEMRLTLLGSKQDGPNSLLDLFPNVDCHTLFLPHKERQKMLFLDQVGVLTLNMIDNDQAN